VGVDGHNESNTRRLNDAPPGEEANIIRNTCATIERFTGIRPAGWLSAGLQETWDTVDLLAANGCEYVADWCNDDQPYVMNLEEGRSLVAMPYTQQLNDKSSIERRFVSADGFRQMICDQFDVLYREGRGVRTGDGDRGASLPDRRAAPHRRVRCGVEIHLQARAGVEGDRRGNCTALSRADERRTVREDQAGKKKKR